MRIHHLSCGTLRPVGGRLISERKCRPLRGALACHCLLIETGAAAGCASWCAGMEPMCA
jgi:hypothetical protein